LRRFRKTVSVGAEVTSGGRLFQRRLPATGNARSLAEMLDRITISSRKCCVLTANLARMFAPAPSPKHTTSCTLQSKHIRIHCHISSTANNAAFQHSSIADFAPVPVSENHIDRLSAFARSRIPCASSCENMTSSTEPEIHNVLHCRERKTEPRSQITLREAWVCGFSDMRTDRQTDRQTLTAMPRKSTVSKSRSQLWRNQTSTSVFAN